MYTVNQESFTSYLKAVAAAKSANAEVLDDQGIRRWYPATSTVSAKQVRRYNEQLAAYSAQQNARKVAA